MKKILLLCLPILALACQNNTSQYVVIDGFAEGTTYHIVYKDSLNRNLSAEITSFFEKFENSLSIYNPASLVSRFNGGDSTVVPDRWFVECFELSQHVSRKSNGLFDITLRPLIAAYGFGGKQGLNNVSQIQIDSMLAFVGYEKISITDGAINRQDPRTELDFNAIAKGYSVDLLGRMFDSLGINNYLVEVGGEIICKGVNSKGSDWIVAIDTPAEGNFMPGADTQAKLHLSGRGLATSGNYRKFKINENGEKVVHTIDPRTGRPSIHNLLSATIIAPTCALADGFATACMVAGLDGAVKIIEENPELGALFIYSEGDKMKILATEKMKSHLLDK